VNVHEGLAAAGVNGGKLSLVGGQYEYYHYMQVRRRGQTALCPLLLCTMHYALCAVLSAVMCSRCLRSLLYCALCSVHPLSLLPTASNDYLNQPDALPTAVQCEAVANTVRCGAVRCGAVRCGVVRCGVVWSGVVRWCVVRCGAVCMFMSMCMGRQQDRIDDKGWGCAYRSLQTICSYETLTTSCLIYPASSARMSACLGCPECPECPECAV
jgi:hypothetical protein